MLKSRRNLTIFSILLGIALLAVFGYLFLWLLTIDSDYQLSRTVFKTIMTNKSLKLASILVAAILIVLATISFQTITQSKILTPSMLGFDSIFVATQVILVYAFGKSATIFTNEYFNFFLSTGIMIGVSLLMYRLVLRKNKNNIVLLLLVGLVITGLVGSFSTFIRSIMNPEDFLTAEVATMATLENINISLAIIAVPLMLVMVGLFIYEAVFYDVLALGEATAINLGVPFSRKANKNLIYIAVATAVSTALIGPMTFLGLLAVNLAREIGKTYKSKVIIILASLLAISFLLIGQTFIELSGVGMVVTTIIDLVGGIYLIFLISRRKDS